MAKKKSSGMRASWQAIREEAHQRAEDGYMVNRLLSPAEWRELAEALDRLAELERLACGPTTTMKEAAKNDPEWASGAYAHPGGVFCPHCYDRGPALAPCHRHRPTP